MVWRKGVLVSRWFGGRMASSLLMSDVVVQDMCNPEFSDALPPEDCFFYREPLRD